MRQNIRAYARPFVRIYGFRIYCVVWVSLLVAACSRPAPPPEELAGLETFTDLPAGHVPGPVGYPQTPPVGGQHHPIWQNCGVYDQPVPNEQAVHSLEHGAVWITYQPGLDENDVNHLRQLVRGKSHALLSPYPGLPTPVVASAWGVQLKLDGASDPRLPFFIQKYHGGPQTPEPGAPCTGGAGEPIER